MKTEKLTDRSVVVYWPEGYTFGDSFQHAQGRFAAAKLLGVRHQNLTVVDAQVTDGRVMSTIWGATRG